MGSCVVTYCRERGVIPGSRSRFRCLSVIAAEFAHEVFRHHRSATPLVSAYRTEVHRLRVRDALLHCTTPPLLLLQVVD